MRRLARTLILLGPFVVVGALSKLHASQVADPPYDYTGSTRFGWSIAYASLLAIASYGAGFPDLVQRTRRAVWPALAAVGVAAVGVSAVQLVVGDALLPRFVVFGAALAMLPLELAAAGLAQRGRHRQQGQHRVVFVCSAAEMDQLRSELASAPERSAAVAGHLDIDELVDLGHGADGMDKPLVQMVAASRASVLVLDRDALADERVLEETAALHEAGIRVRSLLAFYEEWLGKLPVSELERASLLFDIGEVHRLRYGRIKRLVDLLIGSVAVVVLVVSVPFVLLGNLLANRGPLLYRQQRVGRGGVTFEILKFRTMVPTGPDVIDTSWTTEDDPRITRFGRLLRRSHLDELPQAVNIVRGDLSVVGPRPEQPHYVAELSAKLPFYGMRHLVRPGLTGWAQVKYGYAGDERDATEKLQYEFFYLRHQGLAFDARIMGRTVRSIAGGQGSGR